jgi:hypothetical protein
MNITDEDDLNAAALHQMGLDRPTKTYYYLFRYRSFIINPPASIHHWRLVATVVAK